MSSGPTATSGRVSFNKRIQSFLERTHLATTFLVVDVHAVVSKYLELRRAFPDALIYYAVKANPLQEIL